LPVDITVYKESPNSCLKSINIQPYKWYIYSFTQNSIWLMRRMGNINTKTNFTSKYENDHPKTFLFTN